MTHIQFLMAIVKKQDPQEESNPLRCSPVNEPKVIFKLNTPAMNSMIASLRNVYERLKVLDKACGRNTMRSSTEHSDTPVHLIWKSIDVECIGEGFEWPDKDPVCSSCVYDNKLFLKIGCFMKFFLAETEIDTTVLFSTITETKKMVYIEKNQDKSLNIVIDDKIRVRFIKYNKFLIECSYTLNMDSSQYICIIKFISDHTFQMYLAKRNFDEAKWTKYNDTCNSNIVNQLPNCCSETGGESKLNVKEEETKYVFSCAAPAFEFFVKKTDSNASKSQGGSPEANRPLHSKHL